MREVAGSIPATPLLKCGPFDLSLSCQFTAEASRGIPLQQLVSEVDTASILQLLQKAWELCCWLVLGRAGGPCCVAQGHSPMGGVGGRAGYAGWEVGCWEQC